jgi:D-alanyl-lipoteichoic acid acyltransferase DltB (MBOAT superfamily)
MLFNSYTFAIFFALVCAVYFMNFSWKYKKLFLLLMSYLFYAAWNAPYLLLIIFSTVIDYFAARRIHAANGMLHKRAWLTLSLAGNLGVLSYFKSDPHIPTGWGG